MKNETIAKGNYERFLRSDMDDIYKAYAKPSKYKVSAWEDCKRLCAMYDGYGLRVISKNCFMFTAGFLFLTTSGKEKFMFITRDYNRMCDVG